MILVDMKSSESYEVPVSVAVRMDLTVDGFAGVLVELIVVETALDT